MKNSEFGSIMLYIFQNRVCQREYHVTTALCAVACTIAHAVAYAVPNAVAYDLSELSISVFLFSLIRQLGVKAFSVLLLMDFSE